MQSSAIYDVAAYEQRHPSWFNGGSDWTTYWICAIRELAPALVKSMFVTEPMLEEFHARYQDPHYWTSVITFTATSGQKPL